MNSLSGVKPSGPLIIRLIPASAIGGHPVDGPIHDLGEARPVRSQELAVEVGRHAVERPRRGVTLVAAHAQPADLLPEVAQVIRVAHRRQARRHALDPLGEQVFVGHRDDRHVDPDQPADLGREHAPGIDHDVGPDRAPLAGLLDLHPGHPAGPSNRSPRPALPVSIRAPRARAPAARARASPDGSSQPSVGR